MIACFTVCTNNYIAQALTLAESLREHNPDWAFFLFLVDDKSKDINYREDSGINLIPVNELNLRILDDLVVRYNIIELCTALKAFCFEYIFSNFSEVNIAHYLDPDIAVFNDLEPLNIAFSQSDIQLTPHILTPIPLDNDFPDESLFLNHGIYNLGYLGLKRSDALSSFIDWWKMRMISDCRIDLANGLFVDQLWFNLVPNYFPPVSVLRAPGANAAYWNLHERQIISDSEIIFLGKRYPLYFYHFSGFLPTEPNRITKVNIRGHNQATDAFREFLSRYSTKLISNGYRELSRYTCTYVSRRNSFLKMQDDAARRKYPKRAIFDIIRNLIPHSLKKWFRT